MPVGSRRSRRPSTRPQFVNDMVAALIECEEEAIKLAMSDEFNDTTINSQGDTVSKETEDQRPEDGSTLTDFINDSDDSDQSTEWTPEEEDKQADADFAEIIEAIDPSMMNLLEEGYSPCEIITMEVNTELLQQRVDKMATVTVIKDECKILIDGGTFGHMWGTAVHHMLVNMRKIPGPGKTILTAGGEAKVHEIADLYIGDFELLDGYVNENMVTSLLCEGELTRNHQWQFLTAGEQKLCMTPKGNFVAERHGNLHFWPIESDGPNQDRMQGLRV